MPSVRSNTVVPQRPEELPRIQSDGGVVAAGYLSVFASGPVGLLLLSAVSRRESAFRRFQLGQAALVQGSVTVLQLVGAVVISLSAWPLPLEQSPETLAALWLWIMGLLLGSMGLSVYGAARLGSGRDLVLPIVGRALFRLRYRGVPVDVPVEPAGPAPLPPGPFSGPRDLPRRGGDVALAAFGHFSAFVSVIVFPVLLLLLQPKASPWVRFQLAQAAWSQLATLALLVVIPASTLLIGIPASAISDTAGSVVYVLGLLTFGIDFLSLFGLPVLATVAYLAGWNFVIPVLGPLIFRRWFRGAAGPARTAEAR